MGAIAVEHQPITAGHPPMSAARSHLQTLLLTSLAMIAFAANSVLCRLALGDKTIDPASFTTIRLTSGAAMLMFIMTLTAAGSKANSKDTSEGETDSVSGQTSEQTSRAGGRSGGQGASGSGGSWISAFMLFAYAVTFSFAYVSLSAATGALILFGAVQLTMILAGLIGGERPGLREWIGLALALAGLIYLMLPGLSAPSPIGAGLMGIAGIAWGFYSLRGRGSRNPLAQTRDNFSRSLPMILFVSVAMLSHAQFSMAGIGWATLSGALASGVGYVIWYTALRGLSATRAATVQLSVPVLAAVGGVAVLDERISLRLALASLLILGGIGLAIMRKQQKTSVNSTK